MRNESRFLVIRHFNASGVRHRIYCSDMTAPQCTEPFTQPSQVPLLSEVAPVSLRRGPGAQASLHVLPLLASTEETVHAGPGPVAARLQPPNLSQNQQQREQCQVFAKIVETSLARVGLDQIGGRSLPAVGPSCRPNPLTNEELRHAWDHLAHGPKKKECPVLPGNALKSHWMMAKPRCFNSWQNSALRLSTSAAATYQTGGVMVQTAQVRLLQVLRTRPKTKKESEEQSSADDVL